MGIFALLQNLGALMAHLGDLRKCSWIQLVVLGGGTISAAAATYEARHDWIEAVSIGLATFVAQLAHVYAPAPGTVAIPENHPLAPAIRIAMTTEAITETASATAAHLSAIKAAEESTRGTPSRHDFFGNH